jgi:hypothetical protein
VNGSLSGDARWFGLPFDSLVQFVASPSPIASSKPDIDRGGSKVGGDAALMELVCRGDWRCDGGDGGKSSVIDRGRKSVLRDKRRREDVCDAAGPMLDNRGVGVDCATRRCASPPQARASARCPHKYVVKSGKLGHALSWRRDVLANERTLSVRYLCAALDIDLGNKARLVARVEDLE